MLRQSQGRVVTRTTGRGFTDLSGEIQRWLGEIGAIDGLLTLFIRHTSASLAIQENADPDVLVDLMSALDKLAPEAFDWRHRSEGPDDMPAHVKAMLTTTSLSIPVTAGEPVLGIWQAVYLIEHRRAPHERETVLHYAGTIGD